MTKTTLVWTLGLALLATTGCSANLHTDHYEVRDGANVLVERHWHVSETEATQIKCLHQDIQTVQIDWGSYYACGVVTAPYALVRPEPVRYTIVYDEPLIETYED